MRIASAVMPVGCMSTQAMSASTIIALASSRLANHDTSIPAGKPGFEQRARQRGKDGFHASLIALGEFCSDMTR